MTHTEQLVDALKQLLKARGITYAGVGKAIGLSEPSVKRQFSQRSFSLKTLEAICRMAEIDFFDLAKIARKTADVPETLSQEQEAALAKQPQLLGMLHLLNHDWSPAEIVKHYQLSRPECTRLLIRLDRLKLIELLPGEKVKLRIPRPFRFLPDGPIRRVLGEAAINDFVKVPFWEHGGYIRFEFRELSKDSFSLLQRRLDRLAQEFNEMAELDSTRPAAERVSIGMIAASRPWDIEGITGLRKRREG
jgi:transcriptional regulator with XRE-family HTH domain